MAPPTDSKQEVREVAVKGGGGGGGGPNACAIAHLMGWISHKFAASTTHREASGLTEVDATPQVPSWV